MTNAKSRLVRIIALALVVLMIVPMALVGCGKPAGDENNAAIEEALAAAQAAKDAADKAAADAQAAIDAANKQIEEAKKQAADAQAKAEELDKTLESMKNTTTTAAPATTTAAPEVDKVVLDAHIADILQNEESEYNKLIAKYQDVIAAYAANEQAVIAKLFADARIAILRADTVDYANALVANLATALDAVPTYSEVVKAAYDAIDFASDKDVIDVVKAQKLVEEAKADLVYESGDAQETKDAVNAEIQALSAFGEAELDLVALIATEYYRYTGVELADADKDAVEEVLYKDIYDEAQATELNIAAKVLALFKEGKLDVKNVVYSPNLEGLVEDAVEAYADYKIFVEDEGAGDLYADFCIAFVGAAYILDEEGDYLSAKLAEAEARAAELLAAYEELDEFYADLVEIVDAYYADATNAFLYFDWNEDVAEIAVELEAWIAKYGFEYDDANFAAMLLNVDTDVTYYQGFLAAKAYTDALGVWFAALDAIDDRSLEDALDDYASANIIDYAVDGAAVKALIAWYYTVTKDSKVVNQGIEDAVVKFDGIKAIKDFAPKAINEDAIEELLDEVDLTVANVATLKTALAAFEDKDGYLDQIAAINKAIKELDLANLTVEALGDIDIADDINDLADDMGMIADTDAKYGWSTKSLNYKLLPFEAIDAIAAAKDALVGALLDKAAVIVETYIGWAGSVDAKGYVVYPAGSTEKDDVYKLNPVEITIYSYDLISSLKAVYDEVNIYELFEILGENEGVEVVNKQGKAVVYSAETVVSMYRQLSDTYYYVVMAGLNTKAVAIRNHTINTGSGAYVALSANEWSKAFASNKTLADVSTKLADYATKYAAYGLEYIVYTDTKGTGNQVTLYDTAATGNSEKTYIKAVEAVNADNYAVYEGSGSSKTLVDFNEAEYKKAVDAKTAEYRTAWYSDTSKGWITKAENATKIDTFKSDVLTAALNFGLYEIEAEFTMDKEDYTVVVATTNSLFQEGKNTGAVPTAAVTVFDDKGKVATLDKAITVKYEDGNAVLYYGDDKLADKDDDTSKNAPKFVFKYADAIATIVANGEKIGTIKQNAGTSSNTYTYYKQAWLESVLDAEVKNDFYVGKAAVLAEAEAYATDAKDDTADAYDALITKLYDEFKATWKDLKYAENALEELIAAAKALAIQIDNIVAEHPAPTPIAE